jgi:hypothetical protein
MDSKVDKNGDKGVGRGPWLNAWYDPLAGLKTVTPLIRLADLNLVNSQLLILSFFKRNIY